MVPKIQIAVEGGVKFCKYFSLLRNIIIIEGWHSCLYGIRWIMNYHNSSWCFSEVKLIMGKMITSKELQEIYSLSRSTIDRWRKEGMPAVKVGRSVRFDLDKVQEWIAKHKQNTWKESGSALSANSVVRRTYGFVLLRSTANCDHQRHISFNYIH